MTRRLRLTVRPPAIASVPAAPGASRDLPARTFAKLIAFDRPLSGAVLPGGAGRTYTEAELSARAEQA
jgi:hypothetical protein